MSQNQDQGAELNRNWQFGVNLSGVRAATGGAVAIPEGYYKGTVTDMYINQAKNPNRVVVKITINSGDFTGVIRTTGINIPKSDEDKVRHYWRGFAESVGYGPEQLDKGSIKLGPTAFVGREAHFHYVPKEDTNDQLGDDLVFLAPAEWNQRRQVFAADMTRLARNTTATAEVGGAANQRQIIQGGGGSLGGEPSNGSVTKNDLFAKLGLPSGGGGNVLGS